jgi:hypothetical protein
MYNFISKYFNTKFLNYIWKSIWQRLITALPNFIVPIIVQTLYDITINIIKPIQSKASKEGHRRHFTAVIRLKKTFSTKRHSLHK